MNQNQKVIKDNIKLDLRGLLDINGIHLTMDAIMLCELYEDDMPQEFIDWYNEKEQQILAYESALTDCLKNWEEY